MIHFKSKKDLVVFLIDSVILIAKKRELKLNTTGKRYYWSAVIAELDSIISLLFRIKRQVQRFGNFELNNVSDRERLYEQIADAFVEDAQNRQEVIRLINMIYDLI